MSGSLSGEALAVVRGLRNGLFYGVQIRAPHALVMQGLFGKGALSVRGWRVVDLAMQHATNLGRFALIYKALCVALRRVLRTPLPRPWHSAVAGTVGGYVVWGKETNVNTQINLYIFSRVVLAMAKTASAQGVVAPPDNAFALCAAACWGAVMYQFESGHPLQKSMLQSMDFIYRDSDKPGNWTGRLPAVFALFAALNAVKRRGGGR